jgi:hypothetical protein
MATYITSATLTVVEIKGSGRVGDDISKKAKIISGFPLVSIGFQVSGNLETGNPETQHYVIETMYVANL